MSMKYRKVITTSVGFCFAVVGVTGVIFKRSSAACSRCSVSRNAE
jgi:hypothetical protein